MNIPDSNLGFPSNNLFSGEGFQFDKYWKVLKPKLHIIIFITLMVVVGTVIKVILKTPIYQASGLLMIEPETYLVNFGETSFQGYRNEYFNTQIRILRSRSLAKIVQEEFNASSDALSYEKNLSFGQLIIEPIDLTRLVEVRYQSADPIAAAKMVNLYFEKFIEFNVNLKSISSKMTSDFILKQINELQENLTLKEKELQEYSRKKDLIEIDGKSNTVLKKFSDFNNAYTQAQIDRINKESIYRELKSKAYDEYPSVLQDPVIKDLKNRYSILESDYRKKSTIFKPDYPEMEQIAKQLDTIGNQITAESRGLGKKILNEAESEYNSALSKENSLRELLDVQKKEVTTNKSSSIYYNSLKVEVENMQSLRDFLIKRQKESMLTAKTEGVQSTNIKVIDPADIPEQPISTEKRRWIVFSVFIGLFLGIGLVLAADYLDVTIKNPDDVKPLLGIPALGVIPSSKSKSSFLSYHYGDKNKKEKTTEKKDIELINFYEPECALSESYRSIRTSILLSTPKEPPKIIGISSAMPSEGKSVTSVNLAISFSQLGKKVLIIDGDLRKPRLHKIFEMKNNIGLSTYLVGRTKLSEIIRKTVVPNLFTITSGPIPPNPVELIDSDILISTLNELKDKLDFIFIDTPPLIGLVDPIIIGKYTDCMLLVTWAGKTNRNKLIKAKQEFDQFNIRVLGVILNRLDYKKEHLGYAYSYMYKYRYEYKDEESFTKQ